MSNIKANSQNSDTNISSGSVKAKEYKGRFKIRDALLINQRNISGLSTLDSSAIKPESTKTCRCSEKDQLNTKQNEVMQYLKDDNLRLHESIQGLRSDYEKLQESSAVTINSLKGLINKNYK